MKLRLHEIELGSSNVKEATELFQTILGLPTAVQQDGLTVFDAGLKGVDFNVSNHYPQGVVSISFLTNDLSEIEKRLEMAGIEYNGPSSSHLGMTSVSFKSPEGYLIKVNTPGPDSPAWLQV